MHTGGLAAAVNRHPDALWYIPRNGCVWQAPPDEFGLWQAVHQYFNRLSQDGFFEFLQERILTGSSSEAVITDSTHCKVHQHANGPETPEDQRIGKSRGGLNTTIHIVVDILGRLAAPVIPTRGNVSDHAAAPERVDDGVFSMRGFSLNPPDWRVMVSPPRRPGSL